MEPWTILKREQNNIGVCMRIWKHRVGARDEHMMKINMMMKTKSCLSFVCCPHGVYAHDNLKLFVKPIYIYN